MRVWIEVCCFDVFEVAVCADFEVGTSVFVGNDERFGVHLESGDRPHLRDAAFDAVMKRAGFVVTVNDEEHAASGHDSADTYCESSLGHEVYVVVEEA